MIQRLEVELTWLTPAAHLQVRRLIGAIRDVVEQQVGQAQLDLLQLRLHLAQLRLGGRQLVTEVLYGSQQGLDILALRFRFADLLRTRISLVSKRLDLDL